MEGFLERQMVIIYVRWCEKIRRFTSFNDHHDVLNIYQQSMYCDIFLKFCFTTKKKPAWRCFYAKYLPTLLEINFLNSSGEITIDLIWNF